MEEPIENEYFNWLSAKVANVRSHIYTDLLAILYRTEFTWTILGDRHRAEDGCELKLDFLRASRSLHDPLWFEEPCSVLEVFIAFSNRASFQTDISSKTWFWEFLENLDLREYRQVASEEVVIIEDILQTFIWRTYDEAGFGGMFPMRWPQRDQRTIEIWFQFCDYLEDRGLI